MKLTEKALPVFNYIKDNGGRVAIAELCEALDVAPRSMTGVINGLVKKGLVVREEVAPASDDEKAIKYAVLTEAGQTFVESDDAQ